MASKAEKTRQMIIEKAAPIFNKKGIAATAMSDIAEATKLSKGNLFAQFENKENLASCAVNHNLQLFLDKAHGSMTKGYNHKSKLLSLLDYFKDPLHPKIEGGCPIINFGVEVDDINPLIRHQIHKTVINIQNAIVSVIQQGVEAGEFKKDWSAENFAIKTFAMLEGAQMICRIAQSNDNMELILSLVNKEIEENSL